MEAANTPPSKVTVQCTDPSKVLDVFESKFAARTPLKSLHWKSPSRPLRSIPSLNVTLLPSEGAQNGSQAIARRHQIPGLRETPYVKLYLLRCDDKETYKETVRKEIKQWIQDNTLEKASKSSLRNQEHHDSFEWMIVHVVMPNTAASSQPKSSRHISLDTTDSTDSVNSKSKWTGKSTSTIYDKLRADFSSSKSPVPRVAQVRITEPGKPTTPLSSAEIEEQWVEFVDGLKACILKSFSSRVAQFEEDIREREAQRTLPGWNFCTFFLLKEGLARGFESIGLVEDSLSVYDELEFGLDSLVKNSSSREEIDSAGLLPYSQDLKAKLRQALDDVGNHETKKDGQEPSIEQLLTSPPDSYPFDLQRRQYRDLILRNQVSALDLRIYLFTRRMELLLARANITLSGRNSHHPQDLNILADFMERSLDFITSASRELRADLTDAYGGRLAGKDRELQSTIIGNMVASWKWTAITQVTAFARPALDLHPASNPLMANGLSRVGNIPGRDDERPQTPSEQDVSSTASSPRKKPGTFSEVRPTSNGSDKPPIKVNHRVSQGLDRLAAWTARLILLLRTTIEELRSCQHWADELRGLEVSGFYAAGRKPYRASTTNLLQSPHDEETYSTTDNQRSLETFALNFAASDEENFYTVYDLLTQTAYKYLILAGGLRAAQQALLDIASLAFRRKNIDAAASSLQKLVELQEQDEGVQLQPYALALYAQCLKLLDRPQEYSKCLLECLRCPPLNQVPDTAQTYVDELLKVAPTTTTVIPLHMLISLVGSDRSISHSGDRGGFSMSLVLRSRLAATYTISSPITLILKAVEKQDPSEIALTSSGNIEISPSGTSISFTSTIITMGWFNLYGLEMEIGELSFACSIQELANDHSSEDSLSHPDLGLPALFIYPHSDTPSLELSPSRNMFLGETRKLALKIQSPEHSTSDYVLRFRAATAGLRLRIHEATILDEASKIETTRDNESTLLHLPGIEAGQALTIEIPYSLENPADATVSVKCEVNYQAGSQSYNLYETCSADIILPVSVNVQDIYRPAYWFSRFHVSPSTLVPIVILGCTIQDDPEIVVEESSAFDDALTVFPHQPAHWTIRLKSLKNEKAATKHTVNLIVRYRGLDEIVLNSLKTVFTNDLDEAGFSAHSRPLISHLIQNVKAGWTEQDLEVAGLMREMETWHKGDLDWPSLLCGFDRSTKMKLDQWLNQWHQTRGTLCLDFSSAPIRSLKLAVELPPRPPVVTTSLIVVNGVSNPGNISLGQPLLCELSIDKSLTYETTNVETEFRFELFAPIDAWLIGGRKKGDLPTDQASLQCQIILFPQKVGSTLLPMIDVRCRQRQHPEANWVDTPIEIYNRSASTTINVSQNLRSTTVGIGGDEGMQVGVGTLLATRPREEG